MRTLILNPMAKLILRGDVTDGGAVKINLDGTSGLLVLEPSPGSSL